MMNSSRTAAAVYSRPIRKNSLVSKIKKDMFIYILLLPAVVITFIFAYCPMPGIIISFMDFSIFTGYHSPWVGLDNFKKIIEIPDFANAVVNTVKTSFLSLLIGFPAPIIFALLVNELRKGIFKKVVQTISYLPNFLSWISVVGIAGAVLSIYGPINDFLLNVFGMERQMFVAEQNLFLPNILLLGVWKSFGFGSILYLAALTSIDPQLYEAATIDGASKLRQTLHITLPGITSTIVVLLILSMGSLINDNFELIYGMQNPFIDYEVIGTIVYKRGILTGEYSISSAFGLSQGLITCILVLLSNKLSKIAKQATIS